MESNDYGLIVFFFLCCIPVIIYYAKNPGSLSKDINSYQNGAAQRTTNNELHNLRYVEQAKIENSTPSSNLFKY